MNRLLIATALMAALTCGMSLAQSTAPSSAEPSAPQGQPQSQPSNQPEGQPQTQPEPQAAPPASQTPAASRPTASQSGSPQPVAGTRIAPGSVIPVQLTKTIDAKKAKAGDPVMAKVTMDLKTNSGEVIVPKDTKVTGHVTEAQARSKEQKESHMSIAFDHATLKSGDVNLPMSIQAVIAPPSNDANNSGGGGGGAEPSAPATGGSTASSSMGGGRSSSAGSAGQAQPSTPAPGAGTTASDTQQQGSARPQITGNTQGVIGISNLKLETGQNVSQGSMLTSDKNNVKVESGTMLLLKVNQ